MKITRIETIPIRINNSKEQDMSGKLLKRSSEYNCVYSRYHEALFVRIETDEGYIGWGEALAPVAADVPALIIDKILSELLIGKDPLDNDVLLHSMYNAMKARGNTNGLMLDAIAACDIALWDLKGKILNQPVYKLLGGKYRDTVPVYVSGLYIENGPTDPIEVTKYYLSRGFKGFKGVPIDIKFREAVGPEAILLHDGLWRYSFTEAIEVGRKLREINAAFFECPIVPEAIDDYKKLRDLTGVNIAIGEAERTRYHFKDMFMKDAVDIVQADIGRTGITEYKAIADLTRAFNRTIAPHESSGMAVCIAASIHLSVAIPNLFMLEYKVGTTILANKFISKPLTLSNGGFDIPEGPGLGIEPRL